MKGTGRLFAPLMLGRCASHNKNKSRANGKNQAKKNYKYSGYQSAGQTAEIRFNILFFAEMMFYWS